MGIVTSIPCIHGGGNIVDCVEHDRLPATNERANRPGQGGTDVAPRFIWMRQRGALLFGTEYTYELKLRYIIGTVPV